MKHSFTTAIILFITLFSAKAQTPEQILGISPCSYGNESIPPNKKYDDALNKFLSDSLGNNYIIRFVARTSHDPEYAFQISENNNSYTITFITLKANLWSYIMKDYRDSLRYDTLLQKPFNYSLHKQTKIIDNASTSALISLFETLTNYSSKLNSGYFILTDNSYSLYFNDKERTYCCDVINDGTLAGNIIKACNSIMKYSNSEGVELSNLKDEIDSLNKEVEISIAQETHIDTTMCNSYFEHFAELRNSGTITLWEFAPVLKQSSQDALDNINAIYKTSNAKNNPLFINILLEADGTPICFKFTPEINEVLKTQLLTELKKMHFSPAIVRDKGVKSDYGLVIDGTPKKIGKGGSLKPVRK